MRWLGCDGVIMCVRAQTEKRIIYRYTIEFFDGCCGRVPCRRCERKRTRDSYSKLMMTVACATSLFALAGDDVAWALDKLVSLGDREVAGQPGAGGRDISQRTRTRALAVAMASLRCAMLLSRACTMLVPSWSTNKVISVRSTNVSTWASRKRLDGTDLF